MTIQELYFIQGKRPCQVVGEKGKKQEKMGSNCYLNQLCLTYGSNVLGRRLFSKQLFPKKRKLPLLVSEHHQSILFPIYGTRNKAALWINHANIKSVRKQGMDTSVQFENGTMLVIPVSIVSVQRQMKRCERILSYLNEL